LTLFAYGFRPFFLAAGLCAVLVVPAWLLMRAHGSMPLGSLPPSLWHAHELFYGFVGAACARAARRSWRRTSFSLSGSSRECLRPDYGLRTTCGLLVGSGLLWTAAFAVYLVVYAPILVLARADGKPG
jgi:uncharacterized protein involved in response to NO